MSRTVTFMASKRQAVGTLVAGCAALLLASCAIGETGSADQVTRSNARLSGDVSNTVVGETSYWFEYGLTTDYGSSTPTETIDVPAADTPYPVSLAVTGLASDTAYHYRLCADDVDGHGVCGSDRTVTTEGEDSVSGSGSVFSLSTLGYDIAGDVDASSDQDGANPSGTVTAKPGSYYFRIEDTGPVSCLRVEGNRAAIGFVTVPTGAGGPEEVPVARIAFVEDNGPTGDRWGIVTVTEPATTCPVPTADDFPAFVVGGIEVGSTLTWGDFTVVDHSSAP